MFRPAEKALLALTPHHCQNINLKHKNKKVNTPTLVSNYLTNLVTKTQIITMLTHPPPSCVTLIFLPLFTFKSLFFG